MQLSKLRQTLENTKLHAPEITGEGFYEAEAWTPQGALDPAFHVAQWLGPERPTVVYHHGNNERPFNYSLGSKNTFKSIFLSDKKAFDANLISLRAPFHNQSMKYYLEKLERLENFTAMLATSVRLADALVQHLRSMGDGQVAVSGISLGGWVANLHRSFHNTADTYVPILAGAALDELFLTSHYRKLAGRPVTDKPDRVRKALNFEAKFTAAGGANVFPLLARYDQFVEYERQRQCYGDSPVEVMDKGHVTGTLASQTIRAHIASHIGRKAS